MSLFDKPVTVAIGPSGGVFQRVDDPQKAGEVLLDSRQWPSGSDTPKHLAARRAVLKAMENAHDHMLAAKARKAFEAAAQEADIWRETREPPSGGSLSPRWRRNNRKLKRDM